MAENATVFQQAQLGLESVAGTAVAANKLLNSIGFTPGVKANVKKFRPFGSKFFTSSALGKEWLESGIVGQPDYNELTWILNSILNKVSPTGTTEKVWTHTIQKGAPDTIATYTLEYGSSVRGAQSAYNFVQGLDLTFDRDEVGMSGAMLGQAISDGFSMTGSPTSVTLVPMMGKHVSVYLSDTQAGLAGASALDSAISSAFSIGNRFNPFWALKKANASYKAHVETPVDATMKLKVEADATGMGLLTTLRTGAVKWMRIQAVSDTLITTGKYYQLTLDMCGRVGDVGKYEDVDGVYALEWSLDAMYDPTWGMALQAVLQNSVAAL